MNPALAKKFDGKKFMWDGKTYENEEDARQVAAGYEEGGFSVQIAKENDKYLVYSRRVASMEMSKQ